STSQRIRRQRSRNIAPSGVRLMVRVERWNNLTPRRSSSRTIALLTADAEIPSCRPAAVRLSASPARTNTFSAPKFSMHPPINDLRVISIVNCSLFFIYPRCATLLGAPWRSNRLRRNREGRALNDNEYRAWKCGKTAVRRIAGIGDGGLHHLAYRDHAGGAPVLHRSGAERLRKSCRTVHQCLCRGRIGRRDPRHDADARRA